jgi:hypothetical protein
MENCAEGSWHDVNCADIDFTPVRGGASRDRGLGGALAISCQNHVSRGRVSKGSGTDKGGTQ